ncbi:PREDICTED: phospholipase A1-like [Polistes dominula]|uniref:phospholipase A1 n=1 Tax=Polistes dominula TaxID=743375 RepID=A0ABM1J3S8_POLDO|nr:PREDICTED: phospholipase A1-like [Polistes dominula]
MNFKYLILFICFLGVLHNCYATDYSTLEKNVTLDRVVVFPDCTFDENDIFFFVYTRQRRDSIILTERNLTTFDLFKKTQITQKIVFITHGFLSSGDNKNFKAMAIALIDKDDFLVFSTDWRKGACNRGNIGRLAGYSTAVQNTRHVGRYIARFTRKLVQDYKVPMSNIRLIGHSLGAHTSGFAGKEVQNLKLGKYSEIIGLDPAGPSFRTKQCSDRLCETDAEYVQVFHTSAVLGKYSEIGTVDFYMNYGSHQPGCLLNPSCSHTKAVKYLTECIKRECCLIGRPWESNWSLGEPLSDCKRNTCVCVGLNAKTYPAKGKFYVQVEEKEPYCHNEGITL